MTDMLVRAIPLPVPRPVMEEVVPGAAEAGIKLDIPIPEMADIDLTYPLIGLDWVSYPWTYLKEQSSVLKGLTMNAYTNIYEFAETVSSGLEWGVTYALIAACFLVVAIPVAYGIKLLLGKIWK